MQTIYFDESGFTGEMLLDETQPTFVYASVALDPLDATRLQQEVFRRFRIGGDELKGKNLLRSSRGRSAVSWLLEQTKSVAQIVVHHKKYALACKFFEYIFDPVLTRNSVTFYTVGFHHFIANILYAEFTVNPATAEEILLQFQQLMRTRDPRCLEAMLAPVPDRADPSGALGKILTFALCHQDLIVNKIDNLQKWVLDLTTTSLFGLLLYWGEQFDCLNVYCDQSKPLDVAHPRFNAMIGRREGLYQRLGDRKFPSTFNLAGPIQLVDSRASAGVQIADVLAHAVAAAINKPTTPEFQGWIEAAQDTFLRKICVGPDAQRLNFNLREPFVNALILYELVGRSVRKDDVLDGITEFIKRANARYDQTQGGNA